MSTPPVLRPSSVVQARAPPRLLTRVGYIRRGVDLLHDRGCVEGLGDTVDGTVCDETPVGGAARHQVQRPHQRVDTPDRGEGGPGEDAPPEEAHAELRPDEGVAGGGEAGAHELQPVSLGGEACEDDLVRVRIRVRVGVGVRVS